MIFLMIPLGFSMNHTIGFVIEMYWIVLSNNARPDIAESDLGIYVLYPPVQCLPIDATLNAVHGGDAQHRSKLSLGIIGNFKKSMHRSGLNSGLLSIVNVE